MFTSDTSYSKIIDTEIQGSEKLTIQSIDSRNNSRGRPSAITHFDVSLDKRQEELLNNLPDVDSRIIIAKNQVNMIDLSALTAKTGNEFALFTKGEERLVIRGNSQKVFVDGVIAKELAAEGYRWSGHTHVGDDYNSLFASDGDYHILDCFDQDLSVIYNSVGQYLQFMKRRK